MNKRCPICLREDGTHATVIHVHMPKIEQQRRIREAEAIEWLKRRLDELEERQ